MSTQNVNGSLPQPANDPIQDKEPQGLGFRAGQEQQLTSQLFQDDVKKGIQQNSNRNGTLMKQIISGQQFKANPSNGVSTVIRLPMDKKRSGRS